MEQESPETVDKKPTFVTVYYSKWDWSAPDKPLSRWLLIVGRGPEKLEWAYTYNPSLTTPATKYVEFYRDTSMRLCIREPRKEELISELDTSE